MKVVYISAHTALCLANMLPTHHVHILRHLQGGIVVPTTHVEHPMSNALMGGHCKQFATKWAASCSSQSRAILAYTCGSVMPVSWKYSSHPQTKESNTDMFLHIAIICLWFFDLDSIWQCWCCRYCMLSISSLCSLLLHPDLHVGHMLAYVTSPNLSNAVAGHNLQCWWPSHYWYARFSLTTARLYARYFEHWTTVTSRFVHSKIALQSPNLAVPLSGIVCTLCMWFPHQMPIPTRALKNGLVIFQVSMKDNSRLAQKYNSACK